MCSFPKQWHSFIFPPAMYKGSTVSLPNTYWFGFGFVFYDSNPNRYEVDLTVILISLMISNVEHLFNVLIGHLYIY